MKTQKITLPKASEVSRTWYQIDASGQTMGRVATRIANILRGKHKRSFTPHMDMGDFVVAVNVDKLKFTGRKVEQKKYYSHSGYLGGLKTKFLKDEIVRRPDDVLRRAVFSMLDEIKFRKKLVSRLKLVKGDKHTYKIDKELK
ncbi:MAG TPA: 50S ribosomal protein L13 [Candidatus Doudnabacteria bacterium]|nr:50S ribosomal protein L13 [Candidatus Doudnabacteria bacterium]